MTEIIQSLIERFGYVGLALLALLEIVLPPVPSEVIVPLAGHSSADGSLRIGGVIAAATIGSLLGAILLYLLGRWLGRQRIEAWATRWGAWLTVERSDVERAHRWFQRHGGSAVFFCRLVPGLRSLISIPAGVFRMPFGRFCLWSAVGSALWVLALALAGRALGESYSDVSAVLDPILYTVLAAFLVLYVVRLYRRYRSA